ncbi:MAG: hypothetical protein WCV59_02305 [Parcubacteria group bacterium]|jgi:hypothetical protein
MLTYVNAIVNTLTIIYSSMMFPLAPAKKIKDPDNGRGAGDGGIPAPRPVKADHKNISDSETKKDKKTKKIIFPGNNDGYKKKKRREKVDSESQDHCPAERTAKNVKREE